MALPTACTNASVMPSGLTVTAALRRFVGSWHGSPRQQDVLNWLCACRTPALGGHLAKCTQCTWSRPVFNSCGDRHCPQCQGRHRAVWLAERLERLLPTPHFQVVFTLPGVLRPWARRNPEFVYGALFRASHEVLADLAKSRMKAQLGVLAVLHTWSNDLRYHPHVHCLVTAGGLSADGWVHTRPEFLFPIHVMAKLMRGKLLDALRQAHKRGQLHDPVGKCFDSAVVKAYRQRWVVHVEAPRGRGVEQATKYLARYVRGIAISDRRMRSMSRTHVTFQTRRGPVTVPGPEFVRRFAQHILPRRFRQVRYYGLYATSLARTRLVDAWRALMATGDAVVMPEMMLPRLKEPACPKCGSPLMELGLPDVDSARPTAPPKLARGPP